MTYKIGQQIEWTAYGAIKSGVIRFVGDDYVVTTRSTVVSIENIENTAARIHAAIDAAVVAVLASK